MESVEQPRFRLKLKLDGQPVSLLEAVRQVADGGDPNAYTAFLEPLSEESKPQVRSGFSPGEQELPL